MPQAGCSLQAPDGMNVQQLVPVTVWCWRYFHLGWLQNAWLRPPVQWEVLAVEGQVLPPEPGSIQHAQMQSSRV